ncbi:unnamed protein product [Cuscuta campestris]|uniref:Uncharacterized protein n=1 Tax=Cuscuta campestris TaxID=132261 RepID=A0A484MM81_9ASTE|nr:unnamed protein product [Cuscuta campestris]
MPHTSKWWPSWDTRKHLNYINAETCGVSHKGELVQMEDVQKLASNRLEVLVKKYGGFDFIICQNPCTYAQKADMAADIDGPAGLDFTMFYEFVRVVQRVRSKMDRS